MPYRERADHRESRHLFALLALAVMLVTAVVGAVATPMASGAMVVAQGEYQCPAGFDYRPGVAASVCFQVDLPPGAGYNANGVAWCLAETPYGYYVDRPTTDGQQAPGEGEGVFGFRFLKGCFATPEARAAARDSDDDWNASPEPFRTSPGNGLVGGADAPAEESAGDDSGDEGEDDGDDGDDADEAGEPDGDGEVGDDGDDGEVSDDDDGKGERGGVAGGVLDKDEGGTPSKGRAAAGAAVLAAAAAALAEGIRSGLIRGKAAELYQRGLEKLERINRREQEISQKLERIKDRIEQARARLDAKTEQALNRLAGRQERALKRLERHRSRMVARLERVKRRAERKLAEKVARGQRRVREITDRVQRRWDRVKRRINRVRNRTRILTDRRVREREIQRAIRRLMGRNPTTQTLLASGVTDEKAIIRMLDRLRRDPRREIRRAFRTLRPREMGRELRRAWRRVTQRNPAARAVKWVGDRFGDLFRRGRRRPRARVG